MGPFSIEVIKGFVLTRIMPPLIGIAVTWIIGTHVLDLFGFTHDELAQGLSELGTWGVTTAISFLGAHHALKGNYVPGKVPTIDGPLVFDPTGAPPPRAPGPGEGGE